MQQGTVAWFEEVDPLDGFAVHVTRPGQATECANPGREVVQGGEVSKITPVAAQQYLAQVDQAVDGLLDRSEFPGWRAVPVFHLSVVLEKGHIVRWWWFRYVTRYHTCRTF